MHQEKREIKNQITQMLDNPDLRLTPKQKEVYEIETSGFAHMESSNDYMIGSPNVISYEQSSTLEYIRAGSQRIYGAAFDWGSTTYEDIDDRPACTQPSFQDVQTNFLSQHRILMNTTEDKPSFDFSVYRDRISRNLVKSNAIEISQIQS